MTMKQTIVTGASAASLVLAGGLAFATGEAVADRVSDLGAVIGRTTALELVLGLHGSDQ